MRIFGSSDKIRFFRNKKETTMQKFSLLSPLFIFLALIFVALLAVVPAAFACHDNPKDEINNAACGGDGEEVRRLLESGVDVETKTPDGDTPLINAASGDAEVVSLLLDARANLEAKNSLGWTPLNYAAFEGHPEVVKILLDAGANPEAKGNDGETPLMNAVLGGHLEVAKALLDAGASLDATSHDGGTMMIFAISGGHVNIIKLLLDAGVKPALEDLAVAVIIAVVDSRDFEIAKMLFWALWKN